VKAAGIAAEFNPFHFGHLHLIETLKRERGVGAIAIAMSGPFVQRGGPALFAPFERAKAAVLSGADLVVELPYGYSAQAAEIFARGAVGIFEKMGLDAIAFGCEDPQEEEAFCAAAAILALEPPSFKGRLAASLGEGRAFAPSRLSALEEEMGRGMGFLRKPNNILALEYLRAIASMKASLEPIFVLRDEGFKGAAQLRRISPSSPEMLWELPEGAQEAFGAASPFPEGALDRLFLASALAKGEEGIARAAECEDGMAARAFRAAKEAASLEGAASLVSTKRLAKARCRRVFVNSFFGYEKGDLLQFRSQPPSCARILAMGGEGRALARRAKARGEIDLAPNLGKKAGSLSSAERRRASFDEAAWRVWDLFSGQPQLAGRGYFHRLPYFHF
jgi:predicted nucleotidyltransferase